MCCNKDTVYKGWRTVTKRNHCGDLRLANANSCCRRWGHGTPFPLLSMSSSLLLLLVHKKWIWWIISTWICCKNDCVLWIQGAGMVSVHVLTSVFLSRLCGVTCDVSLYWHFPCQVMKITPKNLLAMAVGINQKEGVDQIVQKVLDLYLLQEPEFFGSTTILNFAWIIHVHSWPRLFAWRFIYPVNMAVNFLDAFWTSIEAWVFFW